MTEKYPTLDQILAERVMKWRLVNYEDDTVATLPEHYEDAARDDGWTWQGDESGEEAWQWKPTECLDHAFALAEKIGGLWLDAQFHIMETFRGPNEKWCAVFVEPYSFFAPTPEMAICLAAKAWSETQQ